MKPAPPVTIAVLLVGMRPRRVVVYLTIITFRRPAVDSLCRRSRTKREHTRYPDVAPGASHDDAGEALRSGRDDDARQPALRRSAGGRLFSRRRPAARLLARGDG